MRREALLAALLLAGCGGATGGGGPARDAVPGRSPGSLSGTVTVFAAASLTDAFERLAEGFERDQPGVDVVLSFGASSSLAQQVLAGAPADVFAAASPATMRTVTDAGNATGPTTFARNRLQIAVPVGNPGGVSRLADLARPELTVALCAPQVPCGAAAGQVFAARGLTPSPDTLEPDVKAVLSKVLLGEVDAGLVYRTDVLAAGDRVEGIPFPEAGVAVNDYPVAVLSDAPNPAAARAFVDRLLGEEGQRVLADAGFDRP